MRLLILSFLVGGAVGLAYGLIGVRSPAPGIAALLGLLGMLLGEQVPRLWKPAPAPPPAQVAAEQPSSSG